MLRLIKDNEIKGYLLILALDEICGIYFCETLESYRTIGDLFDNWIRVDESFDIIKIYPFEVGAKVEGNWVFEGNDN